MSKIVDTPLETRTRPSRICIGSLLIDCDRYFLRDFVVLDMYLYDIILSID